MKLELLLFSSHFFTFIMYRRIFLFLVVFCFLFTNTLAIQCYTGTDRQCTLSPKTIKCGSDEPCQCAKYRFQCTKDDQACNQQEQTAQTKKWAYTIVSKSTCKTLQTATNVYEDITCCSKNKCNRPATGRCSWSQERRRALRKLTDLIDF
ncbi:hypothetical protein I4U23_012513 [Adineta vaga]|nr:hypothetical protein I4U23_012513 [Adineta vaga]